MPVKKTTVATFGAALASLYGTSHLQADYVTLSMNPGTVAWGNSTSITVTGGTFSGALPLVENVNTFLRHIHGGVNFSSMNFSAFSSPLDPNTFTGGGSFFDLFGITGTRYVGFKDTAGNVGWYSVNIAANGGPLTFTGGQYGSLGEVLHVGIIIVPEPSAATGLALLALGAAGVRRRKKVGESKTVAQAE